MRTRGRCFGLAALLVVVLTGSFVLPASAQSVPVRVVANAEGSLFVVRGGQAWPLVPNPVDDPALGSLAIGDEIKGTLPPPPESFPPGQSPATGIVDVLPDGSLYLVRDTHPGFAVYPLVPDAMSDADLAKLTLGDAIDAKLPQLWTDQTQSAPGGSPQDTINCDAGQLLRQGVVSYQCDDGEYELNPDQNEMYRPDDPQRPDTSVRGQLFPLIGQPYQNPPQWIDKQGRTCELDQDQHGVKPAQIRCHS